MIYEFQATQSYNGYTKPWAGGTYENLMDWATPYRTGSGYYGSEIGTQITPGISSNVSVSEDGSTNFLISVKAAWNFATFVSLPLEEGETYFLDYTRTIVDYTGTSFGRDVYVLDEDYKITRVLAHNASLTAYSNSITLAEGEKYISLSIGSRSGTIFNLMILSPMLIKSATAPADYTPYANICMPEGFNIWDPENQELVQLYAGYVNDVTRELYLRPVYTEYAGEELVGPWMSSLDPYDEDATPREGAFVIDFGGEMTSFEITDYMLQTLLDSLGIRRFFYSGASLLNSMMDQAQGRVRSDEELLLLSRPLKVIAIGDQLPAGLKFKPISKDVLPGLPGKFIR